MDGDTTETAPRMDELALRRVVAEAMSGLAAALTGAAGAILLLLWVSSWDDVGELALWHFWFWPLLAGALTLQTKGHSLRHRLEDASEDG